MQSVRVQFTTDELKEKSRAAILRIGAKQEGSARHERIMPDGRKRNSVRFSIIDSEWPVADCLFPFAHRFHHAHRQI
jgi:RimJ/RimL family protein N-acetyltransferase